MKYRVALVVMTAMLLTACGSKVEETSIEVETNQVETIIQSTTEVVQEVPSGESSSETQSEETIVLSEEEKQQIQHLDSIMSSIALTKNDCDDMMASIVETLANADSKFWGDNGKKQEINKSLSDIQSELSQIVATENVTPYFDKVSKLVKELDSYVNYLQDRDTSTQAAPLILKCIQTSHKFDQKYNTCKIDLEKIKANLEGIEYVELVNTKFDDDLDKYQKAAVVAVKLIQAAEGEDIQLDEINIHEKGAMIAKIRYYKNGQEKSVGIDITQDFDVLLSAYSLSHGKYKEATNSILGGFFATISETDHDVNTARVMRAIEHYDKAQ